MPVAEELKVYAVGGRRVVFVCAGMAEGVRDHMGSRGFPAEVSRTPGPGLDRLELPRHANIEEAQAVLDTWPR
jgi:hypothetical protein